MQKKESTDWTKYYNKPKSRFSIITQKITLKYIMDIIKEVGMVGQWTIMECGGGNSCFAGSVVEDLDIAQYDIIDKCEVSVEKADEKDVIAHTYCLDLTEKIETENIIQSYDFVYSVGLVEHFSDTDRQKVIANHFELCKPDGYVLITAPTPTFKYRFIRKCMEILHVWQFWDERPIALEKLVKELGTYGEIMHAGVNKRLPLTQAVVLVRKNAGI